MWDFRLSQHGYKGESTTPKTVTDLQQVSEVVNLRVQFHLEEHPHSQHTHCPRNSSEASQEPCGQAESEHRLCLPSQEAHGLRSHMVALPQCLIGYTGQGRKGPHKAVSAWGDGESLGAVLETSHHICTYRLHELDRDQFWVCKWQRSSRKAVERQC